MANATVRASAGTNVVSASPITVTFPGTPVVGDPIGIWFTTNDNTRTPTTPAGWTLQSSAAIGTAFRAFFTKIYASGDGASVSMTWNGAVNASQVVAVFNGSVHSGFGTIGTVTTRAVSALTTTAVLTGSPANPNLVVSHEKSATHASAPAISPTTTTIVNQIDATASSGSMFVGSYDTAGGTADRTITYPTTSANGAAYQIPLLLASARQPIQTHNRVALNRASNY